MGCVGRHRTGAVRGCKNRGGGMGAGLGNADGKERVGAVGAQLRMSARDGTVEGTEGGGVRRTQTGGEGGRGWARGCGAVRGKELT